jgi:predicted acetyltransferase
MFRILFLGVCEKETDFIVSDWDIVREFAYRKFWRFLLFYADSSGMTIRLSFSTF